MHEGNANQRLASEAVKIRLLPSNEVPDLFKNEFNRLLTIIDDTINNLSAPGLRPTRLGSIRNKTAIKYIKLLMDIEEALQQD